jgi:ankyrin repeat protein
MGSTLASDLQERLYTAARDGTGENIRALVKEGADVLQCTADGRTALHFAAYFGNVETARVMLELGGDALAQTALANNTPLHMAAGAGHSEIVKLLVREMGGGGLAAQTAHGATPLHLAALHGHLETLKLLLNLGSDMHAQAKTGDTPLHVAAACGKAETVKLLLELGANLRAQDMNGATPLHHAAASHGQVEPVKLLLESGANLHAQDMDGATPLHGAANFGQLETVKLLVDMGSSVLARDNHGMTPLHFAESKGHEAVVSFLRLNANNKRHPKSTTAPIVDPAAQAAAEVAAAAMADLLIAEEDDLKQAPPSKQGNSNKARKQRNRKKASPDELNTGAKGHNEANTSSVASSSGIRRDIVGERDDMQRDAARYSKLDGEMDAHGEEENAVPAVFDNSGQGHSEPRDSIGGNVQQLEASSSVECEADTSDRGVVEQPTTTQTERRQQKERERKGKQRQRKRATTWSTLEEALARVDTAGASLDNLNALDAAIVSAKRILEHIGASSSTDAQAVPSAASSDLSEVLRQAEEKSLNLRRELRAIAKAAAYDQLEEGLVRSAVAESSAHVQEQQQGSIVPPPSAMSSSAIASAENGNTCVVCLAAPKNSLLLPCKHLAMCAECTKAIFTSSTQPQCPVCRSRIVDCIYGVFCF